MRGGIGMPGIINIGGQSFEELRKRQCFYIDKTEFIREWWEAEDDITLITRPRRFGKTLNLSMLECFFSNRYAGRSDLFEGLSIWEEEKYYKIQGIYPTINLSFAQPRISMLLRLGLHSRKFLLLWRSRGCQLKKMM